VPSVIAGELTCSHPSERRAQATPDQTHLISPAVPQPFRGGIPHRDLSLFELRVRPTGSARFRPNRSSLHTTRASHSRSGRNGGRPAKLSVAVLLQRVGQYDAALPSKGCCPKICRKASVPECFRTKEHSFAGSETRTSQIKAYKDAEAPFRSFMARVPTSIPEE
jgi:hypothetical protein